MIPLVDAHAHGWSRRELRARKDILTLLCATDPEEARLVVERRGKMLLPCCALHPWKAGRFDAREMLPWMDACPVIGEIGLDSVWTETDMEAQRRAFHFQLDTAARLNRPVVLHTKGMEREIAESLRGFSPPCLVHWYSCEEYLEMYLDRDCYFTVGPDYATNPAVRKVLRLTPLNRLLTESDGMDAVSWALERDVAPEELSSVLEGELRAIAEAKGIAPDKARSAVYENFVRWIGGRGA